MYYSTKNSIEKVYDVLKYQKRIKSIDKYSYLSKKDFHDNYAMKGYPVIYNTKEILNFNDLTLSEVLNSIFKKFENKQISVRPLIYDNIEDYFVIRKIKTKLLSDFINEFLNNDFINAGYAANNKLTETELNYLGLKNPYFYDPDYFQSAKLWIGAKGVETPLHIDGLDNFVIQIIGKKKWTIYPIKDYPNLSMFIPNPEGNPNFHASRLDLRNLKRIKDKNFLKAKGISFTLKAGESLYIPAGWAHYVRTIENSVMVNYWTKRNIEPAVIQRKLY